MPHYSASVPILKPKKNRENGIFFLVSFGTNAYDIADRNNSRFVEVQYVKTTEDNHDCISLVDALCIKWETGYGRGTNGDFRWRLFLVHGAAF